MSPAKDIKIIENLLEILDRIHSPLSQFGHALLRIFPVIFQDVKPVLSGFLPGFPAKWHCEDGLVVSLLAW